MKMISEDDSNCSNSNGMKSQFDFKHSYGITETTFEKASKTNILIRRIIVFTLIPTVTYAV